MIYKKLIRPVLFRLTKKDPEKAHELAIDLLKIVGASNYLGRGMKKFSAVNDPRLVQKVFGLEFKNPVGLAAGFDKNAEALGGLAALGFGFIEAGTITPHYQAGNDRPRMFRLQKDQALINRMGFNNIGADNIVRSNLILRRNKESPLGISIGKFKTTHLENAAEDYVRVLRTLHNFGDYFAINISSPNTPGLRKLQDKERFDLLLEELNKEMDRLSRPSGKKIKPILVKIAPDIRCLELDDILEICEKRMVSGIIAANTSVNRENLSAKGRIVGEAGGLSGKPLFKKTLSLISYIHARTQGKLPIIGVGGIFSAEEAYEMFRAGASLIQVFTGMIYEGPMIARNINRGLVKIFEKEGVKRISEIRTHPPSRDIGTTEGKGGETNEKVRKCYIVRRPDCQHHN